MHTYLERKVMLGMNIWSKSDTASTLESFTWANLVVAYHCCALPMRSWIARAINVTFCITKKVKIDKSTNMYEWQNTKKLFSKISPWPSWADHIESVSMKGKESWLSPAKHKKMHVMTYIFLEGIAELGPWAELDGALDEPKWNVWKDVEIRKTKLCIMNNTKT
jgi:hypothetical protein